MADHDPLKANPRCAARPHLAPMTAELRARLAVDPGEPLSGMVREDCPEVLGDAETGDNIAIDGVWWRIVASTRANDVVEIQYTGPDEALPLDPLIRRPKSIEGDWSIPAILAHICCQLPATPPSGRSSHSA